MAKKTKFKQYEAIVFSPDWWEPSYHGKHPLTKDQVVYYLGDIPNVPGHCIVVTFEGVSVPMVHPEDFRKAKECEL